MVESLRRKWFFIGLVGVIDVSSIVSFFSFFYSVRTAYTGKLNNPIPFVDNTSIYDDWDDFVYSVGTSTITWLPRLLLVMSEAPFVGGPIGATLALAVVTGEVAGGRHEESEVAFGESLYSATFDDSNRLRTHSFGSSLII